MEYAPRKIKLPEKWQEREPFTVQKHHLDTNHHVNNCQYVSMAQDYLPGDFYVRQMLSLIHISTGAIWCILSMWRISGEMT